jgi:hypothetical protein
MKPVEDTAMISPRVQALRRIALAYPDTQEGTSCTKRAFKVRNKSFLFVGSNDRGYNVMVKLGGSLPEAAALAETQPTQYKLGLHGWTTVTFRHDQSPPAGLLERWIDESYRLLAPKSLLAMLPERGSPGLPKKPTAKRPTAKRPTAKKPTAKKPTAKKPVTTRSAKKSSTSR